jgi:hypothetical protein
MIKPEKMPNAVYALQSVLIKAREMAYQSASARDLGGILDYAEMLPRFIASEEDETDKFREYLAEIADGYKCAFVLQRFDEPAPPKW